MKSFVLLSKRTGQLCEGYRVWLHDLVREWESPLVHESSYQVIMTEEDGYHGWIVCSQVANEFKVWMNRVFVEDEFINLGEL